MWYWLNRASALLCAILYSTFWIIAASTIEPILITRVPPTIGSAVLMMMPSVSFCLLASTDASRYCFGIPSPPILYLRRRYKNEQKLAIEIPQILPATENAKIVLCASM